MPTSNNRTRAGRRIALVALLVAAGFAYAQPPSGDWPMYSLDLAGTRFSPLTEINPRNVRRLEQAWAVPVARGAAADDEAPGPAGNPQATPIVVDGVMYLPVRGNQVLALEADTGKEVWRYRLPWPLATTARGVAYWPGDGTLAPRILLVAGTTLVAIDARTGTAAEGFGANGVVQIAVPWNGVPLIHDNVAILGADAGEVALGAPGDTRAFDVRMGKHVWSFQTVPLPGEVGHDTWLDYGWRNRSGVNVWAWYMTLDRERGILYMPVGSAAGNYWGGDRPGNNLFANSIVAVRAATGQYLWHFQVVHHDLWDLDPPNPPALLEIARNGVRIPALASIGKTGYLFILNRVTGEPVFGVEERPVPKGTVPGEWYAPTQPFPVKPAAPFARVSFDKARDFVRPEDTSPQHVAACEELWEKSGGFYNAGPYTPFSFHREGDPPRTTLQLPGAGGGVNWGGIAADPTRGIVYMHAHDSSLAGWIEERKPGANYGRGVAGTTIPYDRGSVNGPGPYAGFNAQLKNEAGEVLGTLPCYRPPWSRLVAVDANTGETLWQSTLGVTRGLPKDRELTGGSGSAGPTATAGGLVFVGATEDERLRAFDANNGRELWSVQLDAQVNANPMTYRGRNGKQYVAAVAGETLMAFALPGAPAARIDPGSGSRLPLLRREELHDGGVAIYDALAVPGGAPPRGTIAIALYSPETAAALDRIHRYLTTKSALGARLAELLALIAAREMSLAYEWSAHERAAAHAGLASEVVEVVRRNAPVTGLSADDGLIVTFGRQLFRNRHVDSAVFAALVERLGRQGTYDAIMLLTYYAMAGILQRAVDQQPPAGWDPQDLPAVAGVGTPIGRLGEFVPLGPRPPLPADVYEDSYYRFPLLARAALDPRASEIFDRVVGADKDKTPRGPVGMTFNSPELVEPIQQINTALRVNGVVGTRLSEIVIAATGREMNSQYQWVVHGAGAEQAGAGRDVLEAIRDDADLLGLDERDAVAIAFTRELFREGKARPETFDAAVEFFGTRGTVEIGALIGDYLMVTTMYNALGMRLRAEQEPTLPHRRGAPVGAEWR